MRTQKVLGLDLAKTTLPDAIAAMVEAWYEAQGVEDQVEPETLNGLEEFIGLIMRHVVEWQDGRGRPKENTVAELLAIRKNQMMGSRSNAGSALWTCGITYRGGHDDSIRLKWTNLPLSISCSDQEVRLKDALLSCPGAKHWDFDHSVEIPVKYFLDKLPP